MDPNAVIAHYAAKLCYTEAELQKAAQRIKALETEVERLTALANELDDASEASDQPEETP